MLTSFMDATKYSPDKVDRCLFDACLGEGFSLLEHCSATHLLACSRLLLFYLAPNQTQPTMSSPNVQTFLHFPSSISQSFPALLSALLLLSIFAFFLHPGGLAWALSKSKTAASAAIPGPSGFPFIGLLHVFTLSKTPHKALSALSNKFKAHPLMAFSIGLTNFVISSHPDFAKEILNSASFADRPVKESAYELLFHRAMGFAPYGEYWRNLRRISATYMFSPKRIGAFEGFRRELGGKMIREVEKSMALNGEVRVKEILHFGSLNNVMMTVFGKCYEFSGLVKDGVELEELVSEGYELLGIFNWSDHFPFLGWLDLQGVRKRCRCLASKVNVFVGKIIDEHRIRRKVKLHHEHEEHEQEQEHNRDFVDVLLDLEKDDKLSDSDMIAVLWEMIFRGTDTVAILLEWIIARMVLHPEIQTKAQNEIDSVIGKRSKPISDSDIPNLPFLQSIVKECLRLHPPGPLLSWARLAVNDVDVGGRLIPAGTTAMVNMWAITHNEKVWSEAEKFEPNRFMEEEVSVMGSDLRLAPFGAGRRVCPGKAMGLATVHLWLAQFLQAFKWVPSEKGINGVDLSECLKLSLEMQTPLICRAIPRVC
ncbi:cytochrome P450 78A5-like [Cucurbita maxima]|uniref:Cytochrome P450 78A5-like n=1 Tax=Cucurbita maxima TaxID=3661 RepID=A0A6J1KUD1_CUCMA|nr:cytochrome P450 78A5-like [Cucurbita maxima]